MHAVHQKLGEQPPFKQNQISMRLATLQIPTGPGPSLFHSVLPIYHQHTSRNPIESEEILVVRLLLMTKASYKSHVSVR